MPMKRITPLEALLWNIALPGFGQFLNQRYVKALTLIVLEVLINMGSRLNEAIVYSFQGNIAEAIARTDYQWLMFYPCVYMYAIYDGFKDAGGGVRPYAFLPFVFCAFIATVGLTYSPTMRIAGVLLGPVWLPIVFAFLGLGVGFLLQYLLIYVGKAVSPLSSP